MNLLDRLLDLEKHPVARPYTTGSYNLDAFARWMALMGAPQSRVPWIHIAGTKGKGSTAAMVESLLLAAGCRTGLYTSPHLDHYAQRYRIAGQTMTVLDFEESLARVEAFIPDHYAHATSADKASYRTVFEVLTAIAFGEFARAGVDAGVLETGLGGRLDATNIVAPRVCAITSIGLDHTAILGNTIEQVAAEKAGIIKPGVPVVVFRPQSEPDARARGVIEQIAAERGAPVLEPVAVELVESTVGGQRVRCRVASADVEATLHLRGAHQRANLGLALRVAETFLRQQDGELTADAVRRGIEDAAWAGRLDVFAGPPALVRDGAHCPLSAHALGASLAEMLREVPGPLVLLWGMKSDKDHAAFLANLCGAAPAGAIGHVVTFDVPGGRPTPAATLAQAARAVGIPATAGDTLGDATRAAVDEARRLGGSVLATGSLYALATIEHMHRDLVRNAART